MTDTNQILAAFRPSYDYLVDTVDWAPPDRAAVKKLVTKKLAKRLTGARGVYHLTLGGIVARRELYGETENPEPITPTKPDPTPINAGGPTTGTIDWSTPLPPAKPKLKYAWIIAGLMERPNEWGRVLKNADRIMLESVRCTVLDSKGYAALAAPAHIELTTRKLGAGEHGLWGRIVTTEETGS